MLIEETGDPVERDFVRTVVKIDVIGIRNNYEFFRFRRGGESGLTEVARMRLLTMDNHDRTRRYLGDIGQYRHIHE